jgi:hypothetical protein
MFKIWRQCYTNSATSVCVLSRGSAARWTLRFSSSASKNWVTVRQQWGEEKSYMLELKVFWGKEKTRSIV